MNQKKNKLAKLQIKAPLNLHALQEIVNSKGKNINTEINSL